ncbi:MAG: hypothetical protein R3240_02950 [Gammaproteobacteria bacterium]|nr:hypothetical protein [Gammaproteobacteria bacterium]
MVCRNLLAIIFILAALSACRFTDDSNSLVISGNYPIAYVKRPQASLGSAIDSKLNVLGSDLYIKALPSSEAKEVNITYTLTRGKGMVADPDVSFDGNKIVFSLKCSADSSELCNTDDTWNIWVYDRRDGSLIRAIKNFETANVADDLDPAFLPDGRIVFSSSRQQATLEKEKFKYADESNRLPASVLHILDMSTQTDLIEQISFNRSHDRNPTVLQNGKILFSRWEHVGDRNQIALYTCNPDGTEMNVLYGAHSPGEAFLHARELVDGSLLSTVLPLTGTWEGGALMRIDVEHYSDADAPGPNVVNKSISGQQAASIQQIPLEAVSSKQGRFTTPFPLLDGSNQVLVGYSFFQSKPEELNVAATVAEVTEATPAYGIYMLDLGDKSMRPIVLPASGLVITDPVALYPRTSPPEIAPQITYTPGVFDSQNPEGIIHIKSVYDTDHFGRMGQGVLSETEKVVTPIPQVAPLDSTQDVRELVADIATIKDPLLTTADQRPARFIRVSKSVPVPPGFPQQLLGETSFEQQKIIGYAPIEPDGSVKVKVPANVPFTIAVLDKYGRAFENHSAWLQVRPGETVVCNGCHSPKRSAALNREPIAGQNPNTSLRNSFNQPLSAQPISGETMAETRTRVDETALELNPQIAYTDVWTSSVVRAPDASFNYSYSNLQTAAPTDGLIDYPEQIQPLWDLPRQINGSTRACSSCHNGVRFGGNNPTGLNLLSTAGTSGRMASYDALTKGAIVYNDNGQPYFETVNSILRLKTGVPLVKAGYARGSHLIEVLFKQELFAENGRVVGGRDHSRLLWDTQTRLVAEWIDGGAQYYNDPYVNGEFPQLLQALDYGDYESKLHDQIISACDGCHSPTTVGGLANAEFQESSFVLMRNKVSDFAAVSAMVNNRENPAASYILAIPSNTSGVHNKFANDSSKTPEAYLPVGSNLYNQIANWIQGISL